MSAKPVVRGFGGATDVHVAMATMIEWCSAPVKGDVRSHVGLVRVARRRAEDPQQRECVASIAKRSPTSAAESVSDT